MSPVDLVHSLNKGRVGPQGNYLFGFDTLTPIFFSCFVFEVALSREGWWMDFKRGVSCLPMFLKEVRVYSNVL
jgi:hypothetical protein